MNRRFFFGASAAFVLAPFSFSSEKKENRKKKMRVTAYCPCDKCCGKYGWGYTTASGYRINKKHDILVAADRKIPFGTKLIIPGYNKSRIVEVKDRGGAIKGDKLDVYFPTHQEALNWGVKNLEITFIGEEK